MRETLSVPIRRIAGMPLAIGTGPEVTAP